MSICWLIAGIYLFLGSYFDKKRLLIPGWFIGLGLVAGIGCGFYRIICEQMYWYQWMAACIPGILWLFLSFVTREQMGYGDGMVLLVLGCLTEDGKVWLLLMLGLVAAFLISLILMLSGKGTRHTRIPFVPLLLLAYGIVTGEQL